MKTICIKTNNKHSIHYLLEQLDNIKLENYYFSCHKFKIYTNIFIHYKGNSISTFLKKISKILALLVIKNYEFDLIKTLLNREYFYFNNEEQKKILERLEFFDNDSNLLVKLFYNFLEKNNKLYLKGFITFRLKPYILILAKYIDNAVNQYLIEKEYKELVSILKIYVNNESPKTDIIHLIYTPPNPILLDMNFNTIKTEMNLSKARFLSDITFSSCDVIFNTILNLLPKKIYIHLIDNKIDDFIDTLKLIFENRIDFCNTCKICNIYRINSNNKF